MGAGVAVHSITALFSYNKLVVGKQRRPEL